MINQELKIVFDNSVKYAKTNRFEYITVDIVFLHLLEDVTIQEVFDGIDLEVEAIYNQLEQLVFKYGSFLPKNSEANPVDTLALTDAINMMISNIIGSNRTHATPADMFVSILKNEKSYSSFVMKKAGVERVDILDVVSQKHREKELENSDNLENPNNPDNSNNTTDGKHKTKKEHQSALEKYAVELVELAKKGEIDPIIGRDKELQRVLQILCRRKKNNPLLVGEAGVGKTAIAEGLALNIANESEDVPEFLKSSKIYSLDLGSLLSGTKYRGDFEKRFKNILKELQKKKNSILFIDEIHTIIGAGAVSGGSVDASNLIKPLLSNGKIKCIGATTYAEYRTNFSEDKALGRRFGKVDIKEPSIDDCVKILVGLKANYEAHHEVKYSTKSLQTAVELSHKYINDRFLPDSAIDVIDEVGANLKLKGISKTITQKDIEDVVSQMVQIPSKNVKSDEGKLLKNLDKELKKSIYGQDEAVDIIVNAIKQNRAGFDEGSKPIGSFLFTGSTGVGKTELAIELSKKLGTHFERFDMSEYSEAHTISRLIGAPAGYVGFEKGGLLSEAIKKHPSSVLLLDEIEKAHPDLLTLLLQIMDSATLTDNNGDKIDFQNVIIIMTSNLGASEASVVGFAKDDNLNENRAINNFFAPEFRNRLDNIVHFNALSHKIILKIVDKFINKLNLNIASKNLTIKLTQKAKKELASKGYDKLMGARPLSRTIDKFIKPLLTDKLLFGKLAKDSIAKIDYVKDKFEVEFIKPL